MSSAFSGYVGNKILQVVVQEYDPSATQALTTTHSDVSGSDYSFTPVSASSNIAYRYNFHLSNNGDVGAISHYKLMVDGVEETESNSTFGITTGSPEYDVSFEYVIQSWGTSAKTIKMQGRDYSSSYDVKLFQTNWWDGGAASNLVRAVLTITEYAP